MAKNILFKSVFLLLMPLLGWRAAPCQDSLMISHNGRSGKLAVSIRGDQVYVSLNELAGFLNLRYYENHEKKKTVLYLNNGEIKLSAYNSFCVINNDEVTQMPAVTFWQNKVIYVPVKYFIPVINKQTGWAVKYEGMQTAFLPTAWSSNDSAAAAVNLKETGNNLLGVAYEKKKNGLLISITTNKNFASTDLSVWRNKNWLYVTVSGGRISDDFAGAVKKLEQLSLIGKALVFRHKASVQISLQLNEEIDGQEVVYDSNSGAIQLILRTPTPNETGNHKTNHDGLNKDKWKIDKIVIDAGHGGKDPGAIGKNKTKEKDITLSIALKLGDLLKKNGMMKVDYTRTTDEFISLKKRTQTANAMNAKLFISIHCNASKNRKSQGFETFFLSPSRDDEARSVAALENEAIQFEDDKNVYGDINDEKFILASMMQSVFVRESEELAAMIQQGLSKKINLRNRGVSQAPFYVLMGASMPSVLVEVGFISNKTEEKYLLTEKAQQDIAEGILNGILQFVKSNP